MEQAAERSRRPSSEPRHGVADLAGVAIDTGSAVSPETGQRVHEPLAEPEARRRVPHRIIGCVHIGNLAAERPAELGRRCPGRKVPQARSHRGARRA